MKDRLQKRERTGKLRQLQIIEDAVDFASNDYLGLAKSQKLVEHILNEWKQIGMCGASGSRLLTGNSLYVQNLENMIACFHGYDTATLFNCGYMANVGLLSAVATNQDAIFFDTGIHASTRDGMRLSRAKALPFKHHDLNHLESRLKNTLTQGNRFICIESVDSTDGSMAPIQEIYRLSKQHEARLIVDEAHAVGVLGSNGRGLVAEYGLNGKIFAQVTTFGKAPGTHGAVILGNNLLKQFLINFSHSYIYTTALPFYALAAIKCSYALFPSLEHERKHLKTLIKICQEYNLSKSTTPIQPVYTNNKRLIQKLQQEGFDVRLLRSPTVQRGQERLRICLHAFNTQEETVTLIKRIKEYG